MPSEACLTNFISCKRYPSSPISLIPSKADLMGTESCSLSSRKTRTCVTSTSVAFTSQQLLLHRWLSYTTCHISLWNSILVSLATLRLTLFSCFSEDSRGVIRQLKVWGLDLDVDQVTREVELVAQERGTTFEFEEFTKVYKIHAFLLGFTFVDFCLSSQSETFSSL